jgi:hypothetical protein
MQWRGLRGAYRALVSNPGSPARIASFRLATRTLEVGAARWTSMAWPRCGLGLGGKGGGCRVGGEIRLLVVIDVLSSFAALAGNLCPARLLVGCCWDAPP